MSQFTPQVSHEVEFEGDVVTMKIRRMQRKDFQRLMPYMREESDKITMSFSDKVEFGGVMFDLLPEYVSDFQGLMDAGGQPLAFDTIAGEVYFNDLLQDIATKLFSISRLSGDEAKNSEAPSPDDSSA